MFTNVNFTIKGQIRKLFILIETEEKKFYMKFKLFNKYHVLGEIKSTIWSEKLFQFFVEFFLLVGVTEYGSNIMFWLQGFFRLQVETDSLADTISNQVLSHFLPTIC